MNRARYIGEFLACYIFCSTTHWIVSNLYSSICTPPSVSGIFQTVFFTQTPTCQLLSHVNTYSFYLINNSLSYALSLLTVSYTAKNGFLKVRN